jgi:hypothetical protein
MKVIKQNLDFIRLRNFLLLAFTGCSFLSCKESNGSDSNRSLNLLDVPGVTFKSDVYKNLETGLELIAVEHSNFDHEYLSKEFGKEAHFFRSKRIPVTIVVIDQSVKVVRIGEFSGFSPRIHPINDHLKDRISEAFVSSGIYLPYELAIVDNREKAMKMLQLPYSSPARVSEKNGLTVLDFRSEEKDYPYKMILYFNEDNILVGLDIYPRNK